MVREIDHHIQRDTIVRLSKSPALRFSQLKPDNLENNQFMYHLKLIIKDGLVEKKDNLYRLSPLGLNYVDQLSYKNRRPRKQPKIVCLIVLENDQGELLLARRKVQPFYGLSGLVSGKQHYGEDPFEHAQRELKEKTGLQTKLINCGYVSLRISQKDQIISHTAAHVFMGKTRSSNTYQNDDRFELYWAKKSEMKKQKVVPGTLEIIGMAQSGKNFFESLAYNLS